MGRETQTYRYRVDSDDRIVWVDAWWLAFARENGAPTLDEKSVIGRSIWDYVAGEVTRRLFSEIHDRVRSSGVPAILPFRCDSPSLQRHMRLKITRENGGHLSYESHLLRVEPQRYCCAVDSSLPHSNCFLTMCSCCKRALLESVGWLEVEDISARLRLFDQSEVPELRYTVCPDCESVMKTPIENGTNGFPVSEEH